MGTVKLPGSNASGPWKLHALLHSAPRPTTFCFCLTVLLIIGGVEPNPGPGSHTDEHAEWITMQEEILAGLCANATNLEVRDCLRLYNPHSSNSKHKNEFGKCQKQLLVVTLDYLGTSGQDQFTKPTCINNLICRIQNLLPDTCNICKEEYCVKLDETPLLLCEICGQGSHNECILQQLGIQTDNTVNPDQAWAMINPTGLPGIHYLCGACEDGTIPDKAAGLLKRKSSTISDQINTEHIHPIQQTGEEMSTVREPLEGDLLSGQEDIQVSTSPPDASSNQQMPWHQQPPSQLPLSHPQHRRAPTQLQPQVVQQPERTTKKVCPFYRKGTCRHGRAGVGCENDHPKACKKLLQHGNKAPHGCTLGRANCDKFHPRMCATSMSKGICFNVDCKLSHVSGTKRSPTEQYSNQGSAKYSKSSKDTTNKNNGMPKDFLEALRFLREEIMEAMDQKLAILLSNQTHASTVRPPGPSMQPPEQHAAMQAGTPLMSINGYPPVGQMAVGGTPQPLILPFRQNGIGPYMNTMYLPTHPAGQAGSAPPMYMQVVPTAMGR